MPEMERRVFEAFDDDLDKSESKRIQELGLRCIITDTVMTDNAKAAGLCGTIFSKITG